MSSLVIVALPREDDYVNKISSEKAPHMTVLYLGDSVPPEEEIKIRLFLEHAVSVWEQGPFMLDVERRGVLGVDQADVLFFKKGWSLKRIEQFRGQLLQNDAIKMAFDSVNQFPEWQPHLTLGYPDTPAKPDDREYPGIRWVEFDRLSLWVADSTGPVYPLEYNNDNLEEALVAHEAGQRAVEAVLEHYGVKGMKWGVRKSRGGGGGNGGIKLHRDVNKKTPKTIATRQSPNKRVKAKGGRNFAAHPDAVTAAISKRKAKKSTVDALSNQELQHLVNRMALEQSFGRLAKQDLSGKSAPRRFIEQHLKAEGKKKIAAVAAGAAAAA